MRGAGAHMGAQGVKASDPTAGCPSSPGALLISGVTSLLLLSSENRGGEQMGKGVHRRGGDPAADPHSEMPAGGQNSPYHPSARCSEGLGLAPSPSLGRLGMPPQLQGTPQGTQVFCTLRSVP